ncbi:MAG TPA: hypothetical protein VLC53_04035 [Myxococcota bacterium]|nr:hypothetical protein [Myxococcota bacterium]
MTTDPVHTILLTALTICMAAALAITTPRLERSADQAPASYSLLQLDDAITSR